MPDNIRGNLNKLRGYRNSLAHKGKTDKQIDKKTVSELICSAAFGLSYLKWLEEKINGNLKKTDDNLPASPNRNNPNG